LLNTPAMNQLSEPLAVALDHHQAGRMAEAERGYRAILKERPDHVDALHYLGVLLHQRGGNEDAANLLDRALGLVPDSSACWSNRGLVAAALGDLPHAVACHERALAIDPAFGNGRNNLGAALQKQGRFDESIEQLEILLAQDPDFVDARLNLGSTLALRSATTKRWRYIARHLHGIRTTSTRNSAKVTRCANSSDSMKPSPACTGRSS
jgi:Tfp pilus assembly protein PilF